MNSPAALISVLISSVLPPKAAPARVLQLELLHVLNALHGRRHFDRSSGMRQSERSQGCAKRDLARNRHVARKTDRTVLRCLRVLVCSTDRMSDESSATVPSPCRSSMATNATSVDRERRWAMETAFFDAEAARGLEMVAPMDPRLVARYSGHLRGYVLEEFRYSILGRLNGRRVLDIGCGEGFNSVLLARLGGMVTGVDISPKSIVLSTERARINGLANRCRFLCSPFETADLEPESFDVVWGDAILHHLIPELDSLLTRIVSLARTGGLITFAEPVALDPLLRRFRLMLPAATAATPHDRPLEPAELDLISRHLPGVSIVPFRLLGRLSRLVLPDCRSERASAWRRRTLDALALADRTLFSVPAMRRHASMAVLWARKAN